MKKIPLLFFTVLFFTGCPDGGQETATQAISHFAGTSSGSLNEACSLSRSPTLQSTIDMNNQLQQMAMQADSICQNAVSQLGNGPGAGALEEMAGYDMRANDYAEQVRDYDREIAYLEANNTDNIYDAQIQSLTMLRNSAASSMRSERNYIGSAQMARRQELIQQIGQLTRNYQNALDACSGQDPQLLSAMANNALNVSSIVGGYAGTSGAIVTILMSLGRAISNSIESLNERIANNLSSAELPTILICSVEAVTKNYCEVVKQENMLRLQQQHNDDNFRLCNLHEGVRSFEEISELMPVLRNLFPEGTAMSGDVQGRYPPLIARSYTPSSREEGEPASEDGDMPKGGGGASAISGNPTPAGVPVTEESPENADGEDGQIQYPPIQPLGNLSTSEARQNIISLQENLAQLQAYTNVLREQSVAQDGDQGSVPGSRNELVRIVEALDGAIANASGAIANEQPEFSDPVAFFTNPGNNFIELLDRAAVEHRNILRQELERGETADNSTLIDYNFSVLADASARIAGTDLVSDVVYGANDRVSEFVSQESEESLANARYIATENVANFSRFVTANNVSFDAAFNQVDATLNNENSTADERRSANVIIQQLCGISLSIYQQGIPATLRERCRDFNLVPGQTYENLADRPWADRACVPVETGIMGE